MKKNEILYSFALFLIFFLFWLVIFSLINFKNNWIDLMNFLTKY